MKLNVAFGVRERSFVKDCFSLLSGVFDYELEAV